MEKKNSEVNHDLKKRVMAVKDILPKSGITSLLIYKHPELDTVKNKSLITNVLQCRTSDENITAKLEALAEILNPKIVENE